MKRIAAKDRFIPKATSSAKAALRVLISCMLPPWLIAAKVLSARDCQTVEPWFSATGGTFLEHYCAVVCGRVERTAELVRGLAPSSYTLFSA